MNRWKRLFMGDAYKNSDKRVQIFEQLIEIPWQLWYLQIDMWEQYHSNKYMIHYYENEVLRVLRESEGDAA